MSASIVLYRHTPLEIKNLIVDLSNNVCVSQIFLIDNNVSGSVDYSSIFSLKTIFIKPTSNVGYGAGHNMAIIRSEKSNIAHAIINPDISLNGINLDKLLYRLCSDDDIGMITPLIRLRTGLIQYSCKYSPRPLDLLVRLLPMQLLIKRRKNFEMRNLCYQKEIFTPYISGCFMVVKASVMKKVGGFDERFFMYPEDIDLSRKIAEKFKILHFPDIVVTHGWERASRKSLKMLYVHIKNMFLYFNKWGWFFDRKCIVLNARYRKLNEQNINQWEDKDV
jgi:GT2 family glycosyltransferase